MRCGNSLLKHDYKKGFLGSGLVVLSGMVYPIVHEHIIPKISVVMAVYNKAPYLRQSIESVLKQDMQAFELICVDASSTDESLSILNEYSSKDSRITVYSTTYSRIPAITKNFGIDRTKGDYVFNLDADDYLRPDTLSKMYIQAKTTGADAVIPDLQTVSSSGQKIPPFISGVKGNRKILLTNRQAVIESLDWAIHGFALWKGHMIRKIRFEEFGVYSDEYSARVLFFNCRKICFSEGTYFHRFSNQSLTGRISLQTYDRPETTRRVASFLDEHSFSQRNVNGLHFSAFKDCCFLLFLSKNLAAPNLAEAEKRIKRVYDRIDMHKVRKSVCTLTPGRSALWSTEGKLKKYLFVLLTFLNWNSLKRIPMKHFFT